MSDLHFDHESSLLGHDTRVRLQAAIEHINQHHDDCQYCIISGDLVNQGSLTTYAALSELLNTLKIPLLPMVGNHDNRQHVRSQFALPDNCMNNFVQYSVPIENGLIVCLDTLKSGADSGELCRERSEWLEHVLKSAGNTPVFLFMHHPPMALGLPMQDSDNLEQGDQFLDLLAHHNNVKHLFIGHVHRRITGTIRGIPFATMSSVLFQAPAPRPHWSWDSFKPASEAPNIGAISIRNADVNLQYLQFCPYETGIETDQG